MAELKNLPVIFLAFANPPAGEHEHLRNLGEDEWWEFMEDEQPGDTCPK